jgi:hypothetical protein
MDAAECNIAEPDGGRFFGTTSRLADTATHDTGSRDNM